MRRDIVVFVVIYLIISMTLNAQKHDQIWLLGYPPANPEDKFGGSMLDFGTEPPSISFFDIPIAFLASASISSKTGELIAYTNGCTIVNSEHGTISNGEVINGGEMHDIFCDGGYPISQGAIFIPVYRDDDSRLRLVHIWLGDSGIEEEIRFTDIVNDISLDSQYVIRKDILVEKGAFTQDLTCVRHANGRDWWILMPQKESSNVSIYLSRPGGVTKTGEQEIGEAWSFMDWSGQVTFSPDGSKYVRVNPFNGLHVYDFDRCSGTLSNPFYIDLENDTIKSSGAAFSQNNRFLYISDFIYIYQFDMWASDIPASKLVVARYDGFQAPFPTTFYQQMLAPNGKIYITAPNSVNYLHVIHEPNKKGKDCNLEQHGLELPTKHAFATPNFPHYRLGSLKDSPCDTLGIVSTLDLQEPGSSFTLYPNPASMEIYLSLDIPSTSTDDLVCTVLSMDGRTLLRIALDAPTERIDVRELPPGVYVAYVSNRRGVVGQRRFVVMGR